MKKAIKTLEARIERLNKEMVEVQSRMDEPEMLCDYEFAINDMANLESEVIELQYAIKILNDCFVPQPKHEVCCKNPTGCECELNGDEKESCRYYW